MREGAMSGEVARQVVREGGVREQKQKAAEVDRNSFWSRLRRLIFGGAGAAASPVPAPREEDTETFESSHVRSGASRPKMLRAAVASTVGTVREHNEDNFYLPGPRADDARGGDGDHHKAQEYVLAPESLLAFIVADGMGGQLAGEKASQMAVDLIPREILRRVAAADGDDKSVQRGIRDSIAAANQEILGLSHIQTEFANMGTTVVMAVFREGRAYIAGIGDSRAYRIRDGRIQQLTKDHSLADALFEAGTITKEEMPNHKFKHILYLYLGSKDARTGPEEVRVDDVRTGDRFLLASDGLTGVVDDDVVTQIVETGDDPLQTASKLVELAVANQSKDNVTCMVIHAV